MPALFIMTRNFWASRSKGLLHNYPSLLTVCSRQRISSRTFSFLSSLSLSLHFLSSLSPSLFSASLHFLSLFTFSLLSFSLSSLSLCLSFFRSLHSLFPLSLSFSLSLSLALLSSIIFHLLKHPERKGLIGGGSGRGWGVKGGLEGGAAQLTLRTQNERNLETHRFSLRIWQAKF